MVTPVQADHQNHCRGPTGSRWRNSPGRGDGSVPSTPGNSHASGAKSSSIIAIHPPTKLRHPKNYVAQQRTSGRHDLDPAARRSGWYGRGDFGCGNDGERSGGAVEGNASCTRQVCAKDLDGGSHLAGCRQGFDEGAETNGEPEDRAVVRRPTVFCCSVEAPVGRLEQPADRIQPVVKVKAVQDGERSRWRYCEHRTAATRKSAIRAPRSCSSVQVPVRGLNQCGLWISARCPREFVQCCQGAAGGHFEDRTAPTVAGGRSSVIGRTVQISVAGLN